MQGSREVVGMKRPGAVADVVREDTRRARESFICAIGHSLAERRREDGVDDVLSGAAAIRATLTDALPSGSAVKSLRVPLGQLVSLPVGSSSATNS